MAQPAASPSPERQNSPQSTWKSASERSSVEVSPPFPEPIKRSETPTQAPEQRPAAEQDLHRETTVKGSATSEKESFLDETIDALRQMLRKKKPRPTTIPQVKDKVTVQVENIMAEGLDDAYRELSPIKQQEFKLKGEETAQTIRLLLRSTHVKVKKIFRLLLEWLKLLPGISQFFLVQEAKIKADKIIALKEYNKTLK